VSIYSKLRTKSLITRRRFILKILKYFSSFYILNLNEMKKKELGVLGDKILNIIKLCNFRDKTFLSFFSITFSYFVALDGIQIKY